MSEPLQPPSADLLNAIVETLRGGGIIAIPTDTVYGIAALPASGAGVEKLFLAKGRPPDKGIPVLIADAGLLPRVARVTPEAEKLVRAFWPGGLTLVLRRAEGFESAALVGGDTVAVRMPDHPVALAVLAAAGGVLAVTSANRSGGASPVAPGDVLAELGAMVDSMVDAGCCPGGVESTVLDLTGPEPLVLRAGAVRVGEIEAVLGRPVRLTAGHPTG